MQLAKSVNKEGSKQYGANFTYLEDSYACNDRDNTSRHDILSRFEPFIDNRNSCLQVYQAL